MATILVENNASLKATTKNGFTPLHIAAKYGNMSVAKILLQRDIKLDVQGKVSRYICTCYMYVIMYVHIYIYQYYSFISYFYGIKVDYTHVLIRVQSNKFLLNTRYDFIPCYVCRYRKNRLSAIKSY